MDNIGAVGISHRQIPLDDLSSLAAWANKRIEDLPAFRESLAVDELVALVTCNRVEVVFRLADGDRVESVRRRLMDQFAARSGQVRQCTWTPRAWQAEGAVEHVALVAAGFDSARVGEDEIRLQVKRALERAEQSEVSGPAVADAFKTALSLARQIHRARAIVPPSMADMAVTRVTEHLRTEGGKAMLVGVSPMTRVCFSRLAEQGAPIVVANRTLANAQQLVDGSSAQAVGFDDLATLDDNISAVMVALAGQVSGAVREQIVQLAKARSSDSPLLLVDFGVPPCVEVSDAESVFWTRFGMKDMLAETESERTQRLMDLAPAREIIETGLERHREALAANAAGAAIQAIESHYQDVAHDHVTGLLRGRLGDLSDEQKEIVESMAAGLARKFAHIPARGVRALAGHYGIPAVHDYLAAADKGLESSLGAGSARQNEATL